MMHSKKKSLEKQFAQTTTKKKLFVFEKVLSPPPPSATKKKLINGPDSLAPGNYFRFNNYATKLTGWI